MNIVKRQHEEKREQDMIDTIIIGMGIIGTAVARELTRYRLNILCLEKGNDFAMGATKANSGIVHGGYDALPGTQKAKFNVEGNRLYDTWSEELEFPFQRNGALVLYHRQEQLDDLLALKARGEENGVKGLEVVGKEKVHELEPNLSSEVLGGLWVQNSGITCPYEFCIACGENAQKNGARIQWNTEVVDIEQIPGGYQVVTSQGTYQAKTLVNAAGLFSDEINNMVCDQKRKIIPRKGEYLLMDRDAGAYFHRTLFNLPTNMGKGVLISPTVDGNLFLGPTSTDVESKEDTSVSQAGMEEILAKAKANWNYPKGRFITQFAGLRAHLQSDDFVVEQSQEGFFNAVGIESPGLSSAPAIGTYLAGEIAQLLHAEEKQDFDPHRPRIRRFREMSDLERQEAIRQNPLYAHVICRCEQVTEAEVVEAIERGAVSLDGVKRRTRAGMGKCQRGFCGPEILRIIARERQVDLQDVLQDGQGSQILTGRIQ